MKSNPCSPGPTCDLEPGIWHTHNFCSTKSGHDIYRSHIITPLCKDSGSHGSCVILGISVRYLWKGCRTGKGRGLKGTSKRPEGDLAPSQGHNQHCSTINPSLLYYFQIIFKWVKSLWSIKTLLNPPPTLHTSMAAVLSCPGGDGRGLGLLLEGGLAWPQDSVRTVTQGRDNKHELKSLKRTGRQIKGFGLSGGHRS